MAKKNPDPRKAQPPEAQAPEADPRDKVAAPPAHPDPGVTNPQPPGAPQAPSEQGEAKRAVTEADDERNRLTDAQRAAFEAGRGRTPADAEPPTGVRTRPDGTQDPNTAQEPARLPDATTPPGATPTEIIDVPKPPDERRVSAVTPPALIDPGLAAPGAPAVQSATFDGAVKTFADTIRSGSAGISPARVAYLRAHGVDPLTFAGMNQAQLTAFFEAACAAWVAGPRNIPAG